jgi:hypothetical protein
MADPHAQQNFNIRQVHDAYNRFADLYDKKHPKATSKINDYTITISGKRGY